MEKSIIIAFLKLAQFMKGTNLSYNYEKKMEFKRKGLSALRALAKEMGFSESRVSYNEGGIAVSGDLSMYGMFSDGRGVMIQLSQGAFTAMAGYCRSIKSLDDYTGGRNNHIQHAELANVNGLKKTLMSISEQDVLL